MTLRELLEKATGGEWHDIPHPKYESASHRIATRADQPWENFNQIAYAGKNDAALIVALHNCAGELLAVLEAAEVIDNDAVITTWPDLPAAQISVDKGKWETLRAALAALREKEGKL